MPQRVAISRRLRPDRQRAVGLPARARRRGGPPRPPRARERPPRSAGTPDSERSTPLTSPASRPWSTSRAPAWATSGGRRHTSRRSSPPASTAPPPSPRRWPISDEPVAPRQRVGGRRTTATAARRCSPRTARRARASSPMWSARGRPRPTRRRTPGYVSYTPAPESSWPPTVARMARVLPLARFGLAGPLGLRAAVLAWITLRDEVRALAHLIDHPTSPDRSTSSAPSRCVRPRP